MIAADPGSAVAAPRSDDYVQGYATAVIEQTESEADFAIDLQDRRLRVDFQATPEVAFDTLLRALVAVDGIDEAEIYVDGSLAARSDDIVDGEEESEGAGAGADTQSSGDGGDEDWDIFSANELFGPLVADPRWPHFSASYLRNLDDDDLEHIGSATFGESFALVRSPRYDWGRWELGFQAGVFSVFDLASRSMDLVNSDFLVGLTSTYHKGDVSLMLRLYHQSSHLGDEFLLRNEVDRVNLSFEVLDLLVSYDPWQWLRLYGGGGVMVHREPALDRGILQLGIELESPRAFAGGYLRPIAASDFQFREESDWHEDVSVRAGLQLEHPFLRRTRLQFLGEFYSGRSPNGQFYDQRIETIGFGIHIRI